MTLLAVVLLAGLVAGCTAEDADPGGAGAGGTEPPVTTSAFPSPTDAAASVAPTAPFTDADADRITTALSSGDGAAIAAVLVPEFREAFTTAGGEVLPAGATVRLLTDRFTAIDPGLGSVPLVVDGEGGGNFLLLLSHVDGQWLVLGTEEVQ